MNVQTPMTIFSPSSSSVTSSHQSRSQTPVVVPRRRALLSAVCGFARLLLKALRFAAYILIIYGAFVVTGYMQPKYYCDSYGAQVDCVECPVNAICQNGKKKCKASPNMTEYKGTCVMIGSEEYEALGMLEKIDSLISEKGLKSVAEVKEEKEFRDVKESVIEQSIRFSDKYTILRGTIVPEYRNLRTILVISTFVILPLMMIVLLHEGKQ